MKQSGRAEIDAVFANLRPEEQEKYRGIFAGLLMRADEYEQSAAKLEKDLLELKRDDLRVDKICEFVLKDLGQKEKILATALAALGSADEALQKVKDREMLIRSPGIN